MNTDQQLNLGVAAPLAASLVAAPTGPTVHQSAAGTLSNVAVVASPRLMALTHALTSAGRTVYCTSNSVILLSTSAAAAGGFPTSGGIFSDVVPTAPVLLAILLLTTQLSALLDTLLGHIFHLNSRFGWHTVTARQSLPSLWSDWTQEVRLSCPPEADHP